jgi:hypothetical protein
MAEIPQRGGGSEHASPKQAIEALERKLSLRLSVSELARLRRRFAFACHPDRVPPELRAEAASAMAAANARIDQALKRARRA